MRIEVAASPEDENALEEYTFAFYPDFFTMRLVRARRFIRSNEYAPWQETRHWFYPDLTGASTMDQPEVPAWAIHDAKYIILQKIEYKE